MIEAFTGTYIAQMNVDSWGWGDQLGYLGFDFNAIPVFYALDEQGLPTGAVIDGGAWGENIPENMAPPLNEFFRSSAP